jgi:hypothetical protein
MRLLCQRVAQRANNEEKERGKFFQDRFGATRLTDEASLLACAAYVDLNPTRAAMAMTLESSAHTSVQTRIEAMTAKDSDQNSTEQDPPDDAFLSPLTINEKADPIGPSPSQNGKRCSDKGVLAMPIDEYLALLDWTARQSVPGKCGRTPGDLPPVLRRLGLDSETWCELVRDFGKLFCHVAGRPEHVDTIRSHRKHRRYYLRRRARELFAAT